MGWDGGSTKGPDAPLLTLAATDPAKKKAFQAAAKDVVNHVQLLAVIRMEAGAAHIVDALGKFFMDKVLPALIKLLPVLISL